MMASDAIRNTARRLGGSLAGLAGALLALGMVVGGAEAARAGILADPTERFDRSFGATDRVNDTVNSSPADGPETGNHLYRIDTFSFDFETCGGSADVDGLSIVLKNPFEIPGPNDLNGTTFGALSAQMESDFPDFAHWDGWSLPPPTTFALNTSGFHGVSACFFFGEDVGQAGNLDDCVDGTADRLILSDVDGMGMRFTIDLAAIEEDFFACGECSGDEFELAVIAYSTVYGDTMGVYSHPEAVIGYQLAHVPEPAVVALLVPGLAALGWRRARAG